MKNILILGAGRVSAPCIDYLTRKTDYKVAIADISKANLGETKRLFPDVTTITEDAASSCARLIDNYSPAVVINLLPPEFMPGVSKTCLEKRVHMVHPAYLDETTRRMSKNASSAGLVFIAELGLDPGIDHMSAAAKIDMIHAKGGRVESFRSLCGALPSAEANTNPWGYKLSWSPSSLIGASKRSAKVLLGGSELLWPEGETYMHHYLCDIPRLGTFEVYANADSTLYRNEYGIPEAKTIYRGTLRYPGWCEMVCHMNRIGFFDTNTQDTKGLTFAQFTARQAKGNGCPKEALCKNLGLEPWSAMVHKMEWLGFFEERPIPFERASARDIVGFLFGEKLVFAPGERDLIVLCDEIIASYPNDSLERYKSLLIDYGQPKWSAISRTTGVPPAIAARFIADGVIITPGVHIPTSKEIYEPVLRELENEGFCLEESAEKLPG